MLIHTQTVCEEMPIEKKKWKYTENAILQPERIITLAKRECTSEGVPLSLKLLFNTLSKLLVRPLAFIDSQFHSKSKTCSEVCCSFSCSSTNLIFSSSSDKPRKINFKHSCVSEIEQHQPLKLKFRRGITIKKLSSVRRGLI